MSESLSKQRRESIALSHAGEVAHWTLLLLGWLWLGEQGSRLGWSLANGFTAVAIWWAARLLCRGQSWVFRCPPLLTGLFGWAVALGVGLTHQLPDSLSMHWSLLMVALLWGIWNAIVETRSRVSTFSMGPLAWHPLLAATLVTLSLQLPQGVPSSPWSVSSLLVLCSLALWMRDRDTFKPSAICRNTQVNIESALPPSAMGLMMGSLWLDNAWCAGLGWRIDVMVAFHLSLMAGLPVIVAALLRSSGAQRVSQAVQAQMALAFLMCGAFLLLGSSAWQVVLAIVLPALSWALHCCRKRVASTETALAPWISRSVPLLLGPVLLLFVGATSTSYGPWPLRTAMVFLGILATLQLALSYRSRSRLIIAI